MKSISKGVSLAILLGALPSAAQADGHEFEVVTSQHSFTLSRVASGLENPWGLDWLPDGRIVVTERPGRLRIVDTAGRVSEPVAGVPATSSVFRDGLLDVAVSPDFGSDRTIYLAYSKLEGEARWLEIAAARLEPDGLKDVRTILSSGVKVERDEGFGARLRFDDRGTLLVTVGDHAVPSQAQDPKNLAGALVRINADGSPVEDNPGGALHPAVLAYGLKNPQGLAIDPETGEIWLADHGPRGGGEINRVAAGKNYGWPARTFGDLDGKPGAVESGDFVDPVFTWGVAPTVALSGLEIYSGPDFSAWSGDLFVGSLLQQALIRVMLDAEGAVIGTEYVIDQEIGRIREVRQGPDGRLYVLNDEPEGGIYRLDP